MTRLAVRRRTFDPVTTELPLPLTIFRGQYARCPSRYAFSTNSATSTNVTVGRTP
jgi:hypothetical protein